MVHNEPVFLPIWLAYYSRFFAPEDIYVLDNDTTDGSTDRDGFVRIPVPTTRSDHVWMVETIEKLQHELIEQLRRRPCDRRGRDRDAHARSGARWANTSTSSPTGS